MAIETSKNQRYWNSAVEDKFTTETIIYTILKQKKIGFKVIMKSKTADFNESLPA